MKKLILTAALLTTCFLNAQTPIYPFFENFETQTVGIPPTTGTSNDWHFATNGFKTLANHGTSSSKGCATEMNTAHALDTLVTPLLGPLTSTSILSLDYRFVQAALYPANGYSLTAGDQITIDLYNSFTSSYLNNQGSITTSNGLTTFTTYTFTNSAAAGFNVKIRLDIARAAGDWFLDIDNVSIKDAGSSFGIKYNPFNPPAVLALPNPSQGNFVVWLKNYQSTNVVDLKLYNHMGQVVKTIKPENIINNQFNVNTTDLAKGVYMVEVISGNEVSTTKVIVE